MSLAIAMRDLQQNLQPENMVLSNRDKTQHFGQREHSKWVQTEQFEDHVGIKLDRDRLSIETVSSYRGGPRRVRPCYCTKRRYPMTATSRLCTLR
jgi:hypothetical protein